MVTPKNKKPRKLNIYRFFKLPSVIPLGLELFLQKPLPTGVLSYFNDLGYLLKPIFKPEIMKNFNICCFTTPKL